MKRQYYMAERTRTNNKNSTHINYLPFRLVIEKVDYLQYIVVKVICPKQSVGSYDIKIGRLSGVLHKVKLNNYGYSIRPLSAGEVFDIFL